MEREQILTNQSLASDESLSLPHFDEEATLLSARPVVPLHEVKVETRSRLRLGFGLAIVAALVVGAVSAFVIYKHREQQGQKSFTESAAGEPGAPLGGFAASGAAGGAEIDSNQPTASVAETTVVTRTDARSEASIARPPAGVQKQLPRISRSAVRSDTAAQIAQDGDEEIQNDEIEMRREERREARRLRRERRNSRVRTGDDLMRIREIFEGSPRP